MCVRENGVRRGRERTKGHETVRDITRGHTEGVTSERENE